MIGRLCVAALLLLPSAAFAQGNPGPFGGLFGRVPERSGREYTALDFRSGGGAQRDDALITPDGVPTGEGNGSTAGVNAGLTFDHATARLKVNAQGSANYQEYYRDPVFGATGYQTSGMVIGNVTNRVTLDAAAAYQFSPFFEMLPMLAYPTLATPVAVPVNAFAVRALDNESIDVRGGLTSQYSKRSTFSASLSRRETWFKDPRNNYEVTGGGVRWTNRINRSMLVRLGYAREQARTQALGDDTFVHESIDAGVDFNRDLQIARRTSVAFTTSTGMVKEAGGPRHFRLDGSVGITKYFHRTWQVAAKAARNTQFLPGFFEPLFSDAINGSIGGMVSKRAEWFGVVGVSRGRFGFAEPSTDFLSADATTRLSVALARHFGVYGQYTFYFYDMDTSAAAVPLASRLSRQAITVGINVWVPVINRARTDSDTR